MRFCKRKTPAQESTGVFIGRIEAEQALSIQNTLTICQRSFTDK